MGSKVKRKEKTKKQQPILSADNADKHILYENSVQNTDADVEFIEDSFKASRGRMPHSLREDFCGTAKLCSTWVGRSKRRTAIGLDLDKDTLRWGEKYNIAPLGSSADRVDLLQKNVLDPIKVKVDVAVAFNFSYCIFKTRATLLKYFKKVRKGLTKDGAFYLDIHGGTECQQSLEEIKEFEDYQYVWDQEPYDAITGEALRYIHFRFTDGTEIERAFTYDWRLWSLPELKDLLVEAGFESVEVYWEGDDGNGEGNGIFTATQGAENELSWVAYIVGWN